MTTTTDDYEYLDLLRKTSDYTWETAAYPIHPGSYCTEWSPGPLTIRDYATPTRVLNTCSLFRDWDEDGLLSLTWESLILGVFWKTNTGYLEYVGITGHDETPDCPPELLERFWKANNSLVWERVKVLAEVSVSGYCCWVTRHPTRDLPTHSSTTYRLSLSAEGGFLVSLVVVYHHPLPVGSS